MSVDFFIGFVLSAAIGVAAYYKKSLDASGVFAAVVLGTLIFGFAGWFAFLLLVVFFLSSSLFGAFRENNAAKRTAWQVVCNGGIAAATAVVYGLTGHETVLAFFVLSVGASASDTWSSEIGRLSKKMPRNIFTMRPTMAGLSGSVTALGLYASVTAGLLFALLSLVYFWGFIIPAGIFLFSVVASLIDSMLGVFQVKYRHEKTQAIVEHPREGAVYHSGFIWLSNSLVNGLSNGLTLLLFYVFWVLPFGL